MLVRTLLSPMPPIHPLWRTQANMNQGDIPDVQTIHHIFGPIRNRTRPGMDSDPQSLLPQQPDHRQGQCTCSRETRYPSPEKVDKSIVWKALDYGEV